MKPRPLTDPARYALQMLDLLESWGIARQTVLLRAGLAADALGSAHDEARLTLPEADAIVDDEADIRSGLISINSPIARALIGKAPGDVAGATVPDNR